MALIPTAKQMTINGKKIHVDLKKNISTAEAILNPMKGLRTLMSNAIAAKGYSVTPATPFEDIFREFYNRVASKDGHQLPKDWNKNPEMQEPLRAVVENFDDNMDGGGLGDIITTVVDAASSVYKSYNDALTLKAKTDAEIQMQRDAIAARRQADYEAAQAAQKAVTPVATASNTTTYIIIGVIALIGIFLIFKFR